MKYPIAIEPGSDTPAWGVVVPDLPGCFSAADEGIDQAIENAKEAIALWIEDSISNGESAPRRKRGHDRCVGQEIRQHGNRQKSVCAVRLSGHVDAKRSHHG